MSSQQYTIDSTSGDTVAIDAYHFREQILLRNSGDCTAYLSFNESATSDSGYYLNSGDSINLVGNLCKSDIYMVTDVSCGETTINAQLLPGTPITCLSDLQIKLQYFEGGEDSIDSILVSEDSGDMYIYDYDHDIDVDKTISSILIPSDRINTETNPSFNCTLTPVSPSTPTEYVAVYHSILAESGYVVYSMRELILMDEINNISYMCEG